MEDEYIRGYKDACMEIHDIIDKAWEQEWDWRCQRAIEEMATKLPYYGEYQHANTDTSR